MRAVEDRRKRRKQRGHFLRGPVPLDWISVAYRLPGKSPHLALALWYQAGLKRRTTDLPCTSAVAMRFGVDTRRGRVSSLKRLEQAGLVRVTWHANKSPRVEIVTDAEVPVPEKD